MHFIKNRKRTKRFLDLSYSFNISQDLSDQPLRDAHRGLAKIKGKKMLDPVIFHANRLVARPRVKLKDRRIFFFLLCSSGKKCKRKGWIKTETCKGKKM